MWLLRKSLTSPLKVETWLSQVATGAAMLSRKRMARFLLQLRVDDGDLIHRFANKEIGAIIGLAPETVCRMLGDFDRQGIITKFDGDNVLGQRYLRGNLQALEEIAREV